MAGKPRGSVHTEHVIDNGEFALLRSQWTISGVGSDGEAVEMVGNGNEVARRKPDGNWKFVIDNPYGEAWAG